MPSQKRVRLFCHGALSAGPQYQTHWEDVWLRWKGKPGRKLYYAGPCLCTRADLESHLVIDRDLVRQYPGGWHDKNVAVSETLLAILDRQAFAVDDYDCPNVYTNADFIDRAEAERMLVWFLKERHGVTNPKFVWQKNKDKFFIMSHSFAGITAEQIQTLPSHRLEGIDPPEPEVIVRSSPLGPLGSLGQAEWGGYPLTWGDEG